VVQAPDKITPPRSARDSRVQRRIQVTGCKFSVAQMLCSSAQREGNRIRRERCAEKNAWDSEPA